MGDSGGFFWLTFCFLDKTEKLKTGGCVEAVVVSFGEVKIEGRTVTESEVWYISKLKVWYILELVSFTE